MSYEKVIHAFLSTNHAEIGREEAVASFNDALQALHERQNAANPSHWLSEGAALELSDLVANSGSDTFGKCKRLKQFIRDHGLAR